MKRRIRILGLGAMLSFVVLLAGLVNASWSSEVETEAEEQVATAVEVYSVAMSLPRRNELPDMDELIKLRDKEREEQGLVVLEDGSVLYLTLDDIKANITTWYSESEITELSQMVNGEDGNTASRTVWASDVWVTLGRLGEKGFGDTSSIHAILYSGAYDSVTGRPENMRKPVRPEIREIVVDVLARSVYESMGAPAELVGRTIPKEVKFFRNPNFQYSSNHYYYTWNGDEEYDPFTAPYNPYEN